MTMCCPGVTGLQELQDASSISVQLWSP